MRMTYEDLLEEFTLGLEELEKRTFNNPADIEMLRRMKMTHEALEKCVPAKPKLIVVEYNIVEVCPRCNSRHPIISKANYCDECGQFVVQVVET